METVLHHVWVFLSAALATVPLAKRLRLGAVFGYLLAGPLSGSCELRQFLDAELNLHVAAFGVGVMDEAVVDRRTTIMVLLSLVAAARGALGRLLQTGAQGTPARPAARDVTASP